MDPRTARTLTRLREAILTLARQKPLDDITIGEITELADVNRSTFYQHYSGNKDVLLAAAIDAQMTEIVENYGVNPAIQDKADLKRTLRAYVEHIDDNIDLYRHLLGERGSPLAAARTRQRFEAILAESFAADQQPHPSGIPVHITVSAVAGATLGIINTWINDEPRAPIEIVVEWLWVTLHGTALEDPPQPD